MTARQAYSLLCRAPFRPYLQPLPLVPRAPVYQPSRPALPLSLIVCWWEASYSSATPSRMRRSTRSVSTYHPPLSRQVRPHRLIRHRHEGPVAHGRLSRYRLLGPTPSQQRSRAPSNKPWTRHRGRSAARVSKTARGAPPHQGTETKVSRRRLMAALLPLGTAASLESMWVAESSSLTAYHVCGCQRNRLHMDPDSTAPQLLRRCCHISVRSGIT